MEVRILGRIEASDRGERLDLGLRKTRALCALLALHAPAPVRAGTIAEALWPDGPPAKWEGALHSHVSRLRRALEPERRARDGGNGKAATRIENRDGAYALRLDQDELDARRFERFAQQGRDAFARGDVERAERLLACALGLWRGPALADFADEPFAAAEAGRLEELRLLALEDHLDMRLALGQEAQAVPELEALVAVHPLRERLWELLMLGLYRCGRQAEALRRYEAVRRLLREELGVEPGPVLRGLERRVLDHDPSLAPVLPSPLGAGRVLARPPAWLSPPGDVFVGRVAEREAVARAIDRGLTQAARLFVLIEGEPGIGKTRLLREVCTRLGEKVVLLAGRCDEEALLPYQPIAEALGRVASADPRGFVARCGPAVPELAGIVPDLHAYAEGLAETPVRDAGTARYLMYRAASTALSAEVLGAPPVLVVDDLHWASPATFELLSHLLRDDGGPLMVLATARVTEPREALDRFVAEVDHRGTLQRVTLGGLGVEGIAALIEARGGDAPAEIVHRMTGGNPFYVEELLKHAAEEKVDVLEASVPNSVRDTVARRLLRFAPVVRRVLGIAAVVGEQFEPSVVAAVAGLDVEAADAHLLRAERVGLVDRVTDGAGYRFRHAVIRGVLREALGPGREARTHRRIAEAYVSRGRTGGEECTEIARHFLAAVADGGEVEPALEWARRAAALAMRRRAYGEAVTVLEPALGLLDVLDAPPLARAETMLEYWQALHASGDPRSAAAAEEAYRAAVLAGAPELQTVALLRYAPWTTVGDPKWAAQADATLAALDRESESWVVLASARALAAARVANSGAETLMREALARVDQVSPQWQADIYTCAHHVLQTYLPARDVLHLAVRVMETGETSADPFDQLVGLSIARVAYLAVGDIDRSDELARRYEALAHTLRAPQYLAGVAQRRAMRSLLAGRFAEAEAYAREAVELQPVSQFFEGLAVQLLAVRLEQGRVDELAEAVADWAARNERPAWLAGLAMVHAELGDHEAAHAALEPVATERFTRLPRDEVWLTGLCAAAHAVALLGDVATARVLHEILVAHLERVVVIAHGAVCWGPVARFVAPLARLLGRFDEALALHEQAMEVDERMGALPFLARDRLGAADLLLEMGDRAAAAPLARTGLEIARKLGLVPLQERYEKVFEEAGLL